MKKRKNQRELETVPLQNPVAKFAHQFNKAQTFRDKSKYSRKAKHAKQEVFPMTLYPVSLKKPPVLISLI
jgi:hypothetical protein